MKAKAQQPVFGPKLEAVLARLCEKLGSLYKTQAVKLPYLVDVIAAQHLGHRITEATFEAWKQGVVAREAWVGVTYPREGCFEIEQPEYDEGWTVRLTGKPTVRLAPEELAIVDIVADKYGDMTAQDLGSLTKSLNPEIPRERWGSNAEPATDEDAYARLSEGWQNLWRELPFLDLTDRSQWSDPIEDPDEYFRAMFRA
ncbi:MAG TPA: Panacea domain-containing protein [Thermoanaerobaculia bacterium]|nr:Panacea domain-containing protein [Thermoanaerobaculia bacterium]